MQLRCSRAASLWLLAAAVLLASFPALSGSWVYDDWTTAQHPAQDGFDDLRQVFARDSSAYMAEDNGWSKGVTYRPLSMASLIAIQALDPDLPWAHHLLSYLLHLVCVFGLYVGCTRLRPGPAAWLLAALFALHPVGIEAYGWINGRSDVLAGAWLGLLICALPFSGARVGWPRLGAIALTAAAATLSKEPAVVGVLALLGAALFPERGLPGRARLRSVWPALLAGGLGLAVALGARAWVTRGHVSGAARLLRDPELVAAYAKSLALAVEHISLPLPRAMLSLSFELAQPTRAVDWLTLAALAGACCALIAVRRWRALALLAGALLSLLPVLAVRQLLWLGFDRYLYIPLLLLALASAELLPRLAAAPHARSLRAAALAALALLGASSFWTARAYADQRAWLASLVASRPDDPSGYILSAFWFVERHDAARALAAALRAPRDELPPAIAHDLITNLMWQGRVAEAIQVSDSCYRKYPHDPLAQLNALGTRGMQGRFADVQAIARDLQRDPALCRAGRAALEKWLASPSLRASWRAQIERVLAGMHCARSD